MLYYKNFNSPLGKLGLYADEQHLCKITFGTVEKDDNSNPILEETALQLDEYFAGKRQEFTIPIRPEGTSFQKKVWLALQAIPYGKTISYQEMAELVGNKNKARAVGTANHFNPIPIFIPCHRVVRKNGGLGGYAGGLDIKKYLLDLETRNGIK
ncbi:MAG TPA: methylated-DNA--[protein]-cysteine S-methyltransferase [Candidatus Cloacimonadota bacterium]|nr:methylated-DNA--[protein]-cysteine S-methyltransferase [Candidatus Cloacimonadota bacterium]